MALIKFFARTSIGIQVHFKFIKKLIDPDVLSVQCGQWAQNNCNLNRLLVMAPLPAPFPKS